MGEQAGLREERLGKDVSDGKADKAAAQGAKATAEGDFQRTTKALAASSGRTVGPEALTVAALPADCPGVEVRATAAGGESAGFLRPPMVARKSCWPKRRPVRDATGESKDVRALRVIEDKRRADIAAGDIQPELDVVVRRVHCWTWCERWPEHDRLECSRWDPFHDPFFWSQEDFEKLEGVRVRQEP